MLAEKTLEVDFFKGALQKVEARRQSRRRLWREGIYDQIREVMSMQGSLSIERMCHLARVSRAGFYRSLPEQMPVEEEMEVRSAIQAIALEHRRRYGYRRISSGAASPRHASEPQARGADHARRQPAGGAAAGLRGDHGSDHELEVYLNLARRMKLTGINQLWVADITYIRLQPSSSIWR